MGGTSAKFPKRISIHHNMHCEHLKTTVKSVDLHPSQGVPEDAAARQSDKLLMLCGM